MANAIADFDSACPEDEAGLTDNVEDEDRANEAVDREDVEFNADEQN